MNQKRSYNKVCIVCDKEFVSTHAQAKLCSEECRRIRTREMERSRIRQEKDTRLARIRTARKNARPLIDMAVEAKKAGMSYGEYVARQYCRETHNRK